MGEIGDRWDRLAALLRIPDDVAWLYPPVTDAQLRSTEQQLGRELPEDFVEFYRIHNGLYLHNVEWVGANLGLLQLTAHLHTDLIPDITAQADEFGFYVDATPGSDALYVASAGHYGVLHSAVEDAPGRLLWLDVTCTPKAVPFARSLAQLLEAYIAVAEAGLVDTELGVGPSAVTEPKSARAEADRIFVDHGVAAVGSWTIGHWVRSPLSDGFRI